MGGTRLKVEREEKKKKRKKKKEMVFNVKLAVMLIHASYHHVKNIVIALEGLAAVVNRMTCSAPVPGSTLYVHACHPRGALPAPGLAGCPVGRGE